MMTFQNLSPFGGHPVTGRPRCCVQARTWLSSPCGMCLSAIAYGSFRSFTSALCKPVWVVLRSRTPSISHEGLPTPISETRVAKRIFNDIVTRSRNQRDLRSLRLTHSLSCSSLREVQTSTRADSCSDPVVWGAPRMFPGNRHYAPPRPLPAASNSFPSDSPFAAA